MDKSLLISIPDDHVNSNVRKLQWNRASPMQINDYKTMLSDSISRIDIDNDTLVCNNVHCDSDLHKSSINDMCNAIFDSITTATDINIPRSKVNDAYKTPVPGWSDSVQEWKELSIFWKSLWISAGRPIDNDLHRTMKYYRNNYHYAIRRAKNHESNLRKKQIHTSLSK